MSTSKANIVKQERYAQRLSGILNDSKEFEMFMEFSGGVILQHKASGLLLTVPAKMWRAYDAIDLVLSYKINPDRYNADAYDLLTWLVADPAELPLPGYKEPTQTSYNNMVELLLDNLPDGWVAEKGDNGQPKLYHEGIEGALIIPSTFSGAQDLLSTISNTIFRVTVPEHARHFVQASQLLARLGCYALD